VLPNDVKGAQHGKWARLRPPPLYHVPAALAQLPDEKTVTTRQTITRPDGSTVTKVKEEHKQGTIVVMNLAIPDGVLLLYFIFSVIFIYLFILYSRRGSDGVR
jgi:hypothetical protein